MIFPRLGKDLTGLHRWLVDCDHCPSKGNR
jgi:hypothetical protein